MGDPSPGPCSFFCWDHLRWHMPTAVPKYHACCVLLLLHYVQCTATSLQKKSGSSLQVRETKAEGTTTFHWFLLACLETPKPQSLFLEGASGSCKEWKMEGRRKVKAGERRPKRTQKPNFAGGDSAGGKHPTPALQEWVLAEKGEGRWGQGGAGGWSGSWEGGHIQECNFT